MSLIIDTSSNKEITVGLEINGKKFEKKQQVDKQKAQAVLPLIDKILTKHHLKISSIDAIEVNTGLGSFTGLRVGISIANTLSFALKIPINGKKVGQFEIPTYTNIDK